MPPIYNRALRPFAPYFRNAHLTTLAGNFWRRALDEARFPTERRFYATEPGTQVLVEENRPQGEVRGEVLLAHGLEGSSQSGYMISMAQALVERGFVAHRVNMRSCGGTEHLTPTLYHSGLTGDLLALVRELHSQGRGPLFLIGYSLGGNVVLKLAGELGEGGPELLAGVCAVSTPIDLAACVEAIGKPSNWLYQQRFVGRLRDRYRRRHAALPERFPLDGLDRVRTIFEFDDRFTAPAFGFGNAPNYYQTQSAQRFMGRIRVPTLLLQAEDDPMIPFALFRSAKITANSHVELLVTRHGGHIGYIARDLPRFWADCVLSDWIIARIRTCGAEQSHPEVRL